jgi:hypothetical protein
LISSLERRKKASRMDVKPSEGLKVTVRSSKEAIFGEDGVEIKNSPLPSGKARIGVLTGRTLAGFAEVEMGPLDGKKHWYPIGELETEKGEHIVEEEIAIEMPADDEESEDSEDSSELD